MYKNIKIIGFDLDQTLYPKSPEIDDAIQSYIYEKIAVAKNCSIQEAKEMFLFYYPSKLTGGKTLVKLGIPNASNIIQEALENADISKFLVPNMDVIDLLNELKTRFQSLSLITGSNKELALKKLASLKIPAHLFDFIISAEIPKSDGSAYKEWLKHYCEKDSSLKPENFLYIGDRKVSDVDVPALLGIKSILVNVNEKDSTLKVSQFCNLTEVREIL